MYWLIPWCFVSVSSIRRKSRRVCHWRNRLQRFLRIGRLITKTCIAISFSGAKSDTATERTVSQTIEPNKWSGFERPTEAAAELSTVTRSYRERYSSNATHCGGPGCSIEQSRSKFSKWVASDVSTNNCTNSTACRTYIYTHVQHSRMYLLRVTRR